MLNFFRKSDNSRHDVGGGKDAGFEPPKNLPDLAGDIYENGRPPQRDYSKDRPLDDSSVLSAPNAASATNAAKDVTLQKPVVKSATDLLIPTQFQNQPQAQYQNQQSQIPQSQNQSIPINIQKPVTEPSKDSVPTLDLSLIRPQPTSHPTSMMAPPTYSASYSASPAFNSSSQSSYSPQSPKSPQLQQPSDDMFSFAKDNSVLLDNFTGFFKEFENHIKDNGLNNDVVDALLDKNLLDHMVFYHTMKGGDMPFYASSAELSHAIKLKLEALQSTEHAWILNTQKMDMLKRLGINMESDIRAMSEELKRLVIESRKRGGVVKSNDFFQLIKPKDDSSDVSRNVSKDVPGTFSRSVTNDGPNFVSADRASVSANPHPVASLNNHSLVYRYNIQNYSVADPSKYFYARNGQIFRSLSDLFDGLESMDKSTFEFHVNGFKNDFANWIKGVFGDIRLADAVRPLTDRERLWYFFKNNAQ